MTRCSGSQQLIPQLEVIPSGTLCPLSVHQIFGCLGCIILWHVSVKVCVRVFCHASFHLFTAEEGTAASCTGADSPLLCWSVHQRVGLPAPGSAPLTCTLFSTLFPSHTPIFHPRYLSGDGLSHWKWQSLKKKNWHNTRIHVQRKPLERGRSRLSPCVPRWDNCLSLSQLLAHIHWLHCEVLPKVVSLSGAWGFHKVKSPLPAKQGLSN